MAELTPTDVENYTQGRLDKDDPETARMLNAALASARRYCGWHVTPVRTADEQTVDGPGGRLLALPTLRLEELTELVEDGVEITDLTTLAVSRRGLVRKKSRGFWTCEYGGVTVTMTHGFTEADAADWRSAVLSTVDRMSLAVTGGRLRVIGPFQYETYETEGWGTERMILDQYRLEMAP